MGDARREETFERYRVDLGAYDRRARTGPCFVCGTVARDPNFFYYIVYEDDAIIAFLNRHPTQYGRALVAPKEHQEQVTGDFTPEEYLDLQRVVYRVSEAVRQEVGAERVYPLSLGSKGSNAHVHWHVVPLPPGTPYEEQQFAAVMQETAGALKITKEEEASLAARIRRRMEHRTERLLGESRRGGPLEDERHSPGAGHVGTTLGP